jgi:hypothetical protein
MPMMRRAPEGRAREEVSRRARSVEPRDDRARYALAAQARAGNAAFGRLIQRTRSGNALNAGAVSEAAGKVFWEDEDGNASVLQPIARGDVDSPGADLELKEGEELYVAADLASKEGAPLIAASVHASTARRLGLHRAVTRRGDLAVMRSDRVENPQDYYWTGEPRDESVRTALEESRIPHYGYGWSFGALGWTQIFAADGVQLFLRSAVSKRRLAPPKLGRGYRKSGRDEDRKKRKGAYPLDGSKPPGVEPAHPVAARKSPRTAMGNKTATAAAIQAGRQVQQPYEWCHLIGHGEGGAEIPQNLVAATRCANTEQLAIEQAYRAARSDERQINAKVTAYTVPGHPHVADSFRYKLVDANNNTVIFDHRIDGESQHFGLSEFRVLSKLVEEKIERHFARASRSWWPFGGDGDRTAASGAPDAGDAQPADASTPSRRTRAHDRA